MSASTAAANSATSLSSRRIRFGILACGKISHDFVNCVTHQCSADIEVVACATSSDLARAQEFARTFNIPRAYGSYAELVADAEIDIVYIGSQHPQHAEHCKLVLNANRHCMCEKPFCVTLAEAEAVIALAREKKLFCFEAMWALYNPGLVKARELIASGLIGEPHLVEASFGFKMPTDSQRLYTNAAAGGCVLDLGVYPISLAHMVFGGADGTQMPTKITATGSLSQDSEKIDVQDAIILQYGPNQMASLTTSMLARTPNEAFIVGTKGVIRIHSTWHVSETISYKLEGETKETVVELPKTPLMPGQREMKFEKSQLMAGEARHVVECLRAGKTESDIRSLDQTLVIQRIMDECRRQIGVRYAADEQK